MRKTLFLFGLGSLVVGAWIYYRRQLEMLQNISYKVAGIQILEYSPLKLQITTELTNNSEFAFTIRGYDIDIIVNGNKVAVVKNSTLDQKLKGFGDKSQIDFMATLQSQQNGGLQGLLSGVLDNLGDTTIEFKGKISVKRGIFEYSNYPVDFTYKLAEFL